MKIYEEDYLDKIHGFREEKPKYSLSKEDVEYFSERITQNIEKSLNMKCKLKFTKSINYGKATCMIFVIEKMISNGKEKFPMMVCVDVSVSKFFEESEGMECGYDYGLGSSYAYLVKFETDLGYSDHYRNKHFNKEEKFHTKNEIVDEVIKFTKGIDIEIDSYYSIDFHNSHYNM